MEDLKHSILQLKSKHFHCKEKGCELILKQYLIGKKTLPSGKIVENYLNAFYCQTHQKEKICHCGWEFGWHYGNNSKRLNDY